MWEITLKEIKYKEVSSCLKGSNTESEKLAKPGGPFSSSSLGGEGLNSLHTSKNHYTEFSNPEEEANMVLMLSHKWAAQYFCT